MSTAIADEVGFGLRRLKDLDEPPMGASKIVYRNCREEPVYSRHDAARVGEVLARSRVYTGGLPQWSSK